MTNERMEELAALQALGLLDGAEARELAAAQRRDPALQATAQAFSDAAALLAYDAPPAEPPPGLRRTILAQLPARKERRTFSFALWLPYAAAVGLMALTAFQASEILGLDRQVKAEHARALAAQARSNMADVKIAELEAKDAGYGSAKVMVAWNTATHSGMVSIANMPPAPAGHDYQLWVLDPTAPAPVSAGLLRMNGPGMAQSFAAKPVRSGGPGFAISLEPAGGRPAPTGAILFAVAPGL